MRFYCGPTRAERRVAKVRRCEQWHKWFAWCPIRITGQQCVWLEVIERKGRYHCGYGGSWWEWDYRLPQRLDEE